MRYTVYCPNCGCIFEMEEGMSSQKWYDGLCMCDECLRSENWEMEYPDEQPDFPKNMPLIQCRTKNMIPDDNPKFMPNLFSGPYK